MYDPLKPYFANGLLYLPDKVVQALLNAGLEWSVGHAARRGIALDDTDSLAEIAHAVDVLLSHISPTNPLYIALSSDDTRFMLTGKPVLAS